MNQEARDSEGVNLRPPLLPLPRIAQKRAIWGRGKELVETLTQGGARGSLPPLALGYILLPFQGVERKKRPPAATLLRKMSNLRIRVHYFGKGQTRSMVFDMIHSRSLSLRKSISSRTTASA